MGYGLWAMGLTYYLLPIAYHLFSREIWQGNIIKHLLKNVNINIEYNVAYSYVRFTSEILFYCQL